MSERQETIADIVAEKRTQADRIERVAAAKMASGKMTSDHFAREVVATLRTEAARLEAAAKRESNNAAAMRDALEAYVEYSKLALQMGMFTHDRLVAITAKARDALSAPPRNYDRFNSVKDAAIAFARERQDAPYPCPDFTFSAWLFATATEQKGENNGK